MCCVVPNMVWFASFMQTLSTIDDDIYTRNKISRAMEEPSEKVT